ncbi:DUF2593 family protein, partial [Yersinia enterocolitica]|nr:DUF2593 family protein [Yersinia enterocolitica]
MRLLFSPAAFSSATTTPVPVLIAGTAIIATRFVGVILLVATLGWEGTGLSLDHKSRRQLCS